MPATLTVFAAQDLVFIEGALAAALILVVLYRAPRTTIVRWIVGIGVMLAVASIAAQISGAFYTDPRSFVVGHFQPLISHAADNGFPSDHALLAASIVAAVGFARLLWTLPFALVAGLVEWARVGAGVHHPIDVIGSDACVLLGVVVALVIASSISARVLPYVPTRLLDLVAAPDPHVA